MRRMITTYNRKYVLIDENFDSIYRIGPNTAKLVLQPGKTYKLEINALRRMSAAMGSITQLNIQLTGTVIMDDSFEGEHLSDQSWCDGAQINYDDEDNYIDIKITGITLSNPVMIRVDACGNLIFGKEHQI